MTTGFGCIHQYIRIQPGACPLKRHIELVLEIACRQILWEAKPNFLTCTFLRIVDLINLSFRGIKLNFIRLHRRMVRCLTKLLAARIYLALPQKHLPRLMVYISYLRFKADMLSSPQSLSTTIRTFSPAHYRLQVLMILVYFTSNTLFRLNLSPLLDSNKSRSVH